MSSTQAKKSGIALHQILLIFDDVRRKILRETSSVHVKNLYGLTIRQGAAISQVMLLMETHPNGVSLKTLANHMQMALSATSILVEGMVKRELFERYPNPEDRRAVCIRLSAKGEEIFRETHDLLLREMTELSTCLTKEELAQLTQISRKLSGKVFS